MKLPSITLPSTSGGFAGLVAQPQSFELPWPGRAKPLDVAVLEVEPECLLDLALSDGRIDPYSASVWPSAYAAATTLLRCLGERNGAVLELGCGVGLPALAATAAGAVDVTVSDHSPLSLELVLHAAAAFQPGRKIHTCEVDLRDRQQQLPPHDYLVAADLMYDDDVAFALGRHVRAQRERGATAILADPGRKGGRFRAAFARGLGEDVHFVEQRLPKRWRADVPSCGVSVLRPAGGRERRLPSREVLARAKAYRRERASA